MQSKYIKELLKWQSESLNQYSNLLYKQRKILAKLKVLNGRDALHELHIAINNAIDDSKYVKAINILCKMADIRRHPNAFYDDFNYEHLSSKAIHFRIKQYLKKNSINKLLVENQFKTIKAANK